MAEKFTCATHGVTLTVTRDEATGHEHRLIAGPRGACTLKEGIPLQNLVDIADEGRIFTRDQRQYPLVVSRVVRVENAYEAAVTKEVIARLRE